MYTLPSFYYFSYAGGEFPSHISLDEPVLGTEIPNNLSVIESIHTRVVTNNIYTTHVLDLDAEIVVEISSNEKINTKDIGTVILMIITKSVCYFHISLTGLISLSWIMQQTKVSEAEERAETQFTNLSMGHWPSNITVIPCLTSCKSVFHLTFYLTFLWSLPYSPPHCSTKAVLI